MQLPILFSRTTKGQVQTWKITVEGNSYFTSEGIKDGTISVSKATICEAKNIGRANETTPEEQAQKEAKSKWQKKLDEGYFENESEIDNIKFFEPMTAHKWKDHKDKAEYPLYSQPKLDGMRCVADKNQLTSRKGKVILSAPHIHKFLLPLFEEYEDLVIDGELYNHALKHNFNKIISLAKKSKPKQKDLDESAEKLEYWIYDCYIPDSPNMNFYDRFLFIKKAIKSLGDTGLKIRFVFTEKIENEEELNSLFEYYLDKGFEGQMIRKDTPYENKRTKALLKRKDFIDEEFILVDLLEGAGNRTGLATVAYLESEKGDEVRNGKKCFKAGVIGSDFYTKDLLDNKVKILGKPATICYFNLTPDGIPRFGKMKIIRDYE